MEIETFKIEDAEAFLQTRDRMANYYTAKYPLDQEQNRAEFQKDILELLKERNGFQLLGDIRYKLEPGQKDRTKDWRARDINRLLTRYQQDRPIEDARRLADDARRRAEAADGWAKWAIVIALLALLGALVSAINDLPQALSNLNSAFGAIDGWVNRAAAASPHGWVYSPDRSVRQQ
jgi:hypothetical protein